MIIDANVYWFPEAIFKEEALMERFLADVPRGYSTRVLVKHTHGRKQIVVERPVGFPGLDYVEGDYVLEHQMKALRAAGISHAVMKVPCCNEWMGLELCRFFNDGMADYARQSGGMFIPLAVIPPWGSKGSLEELQRCHDELGMRGVQLCAHYGELYLDDKAFSPMFEKLNALGMTAYVHHTPVPVQYDSLTDYNNLRRSYGRCNDQSIAVMRELFSGMFTRYPNVKVVHSMLGGGFFAYSHLLMPGQPKTEDMANRFTDTSDDMRKALRENIFFEMSHAQPWGKAQLECAAAALGADHILYGSSYPVREEWMTDGVEFILDLNISDEAKNLILSENAKRLYRIGTTI